MTLPTNEEISACTLCSLNTPHGVNGLAVPGVGNSKAKIMLIGEAPGAEEARQGIPFIGRSGQLLQELMIEAGYRPEDIFITNTVKHRPPKNRDPSIEEKVACRPFLIRQINHIQPLAIIAIGRHAANSLAAINGIEIPDKNLRGYEFSLSTGNWNGYVYCTWHPSYVLRQGPVSQIKDELKSDLASVLNSTFAIPF